MLIFRLIIAYFEMLRMHQIASFFKKKFSELRIFSGNWGDQCIILREQGRTDPTGGLAYVGERTSLVHINSLHAG